MAASSLAASGAALRLSCRRALRGGEASVSGQSAPPLAARCRTRTASRSAVRPPTALLRVRDDLRAPGVVTWTQVRAFESGACQSSRCAGPDGGDGVRNRRRRR
jgi:hypothetical protein